MDAAFLNDADAGGVGRNILFSMVDSSAFSIAGSCLLHHLVYSFIYRSILILLYFIVPCVFLLTYIFYTASRSDGGSQCLSFFNILFYHISHLFYRSRRTVSDTESSLLLSSSSAASQVILPDHFLCFCHSWNTEIYPAGTDLCRFNDFFRHSSSVIKRIFQQDRHAFL